MCLIIHFSFPKAFKSCEINQQRNREENYSTKLHVMEIVSTKNLDNETCILF